MIPTAELLSHYERCARNGFYGQSWQKHTLSPIAALNESVRTALTRIVNDDGEHAASIYMDLARNRGIDLPVASQHYPSAVNHAAAANIITTVIRHTEPWSVPPDVGSWKSACLMSAGHLRRFIAVTQWNDDRALYERRSWFCLGEVAHYKIPLDLIVAVVGPMSGGRRTGYFSKGFLHPQRSILRFQRRQRDSMGFRDTWIKVYREDCEQISRAYWIQALRDDDVLPEILFVVKVPVPSEAECQAIQDLSLRQLERLHAIRDLPPRQLSTCFSVLSNCPFVSCCHSQPESHPEDGGFNEISGAGRESLPIRERP